MPTDDHLLQSDVSALMEMTHEAMVERWQQGLVTPMSSTISTFAKTDGSWWTDNQVAWRRIPQVEHNEQLDFHHERFGRVDQARGPVGSRNPWTKRP